MNWEWARPAEVISFSERPAEEVEHISEAATLIKISQLRVLINSVYYWEGILYRTSQGGNFAKSWPLAIELSVSRRGIKTPFWIVFNVVLIPSYLLLFLWNWTNLQICWRKLMAHFHARPRQIERSNLKMETGREKEGKKESRYFPSFGQKTVNWGLERMWVSHTFHFLKPPGIGWQKRYAHEMKRHFSRFEFQSATSSR